MRLFALALLVAAAVAVRPASLNRFRFGETGVGDACAGGGTCIDVNQQQCLTQGRQMEVVGGFCKGASNVKCCRPVAGSAPATQTPPPPPASGKKAVCLTFDDGPWKATRPIVEMLNSLKVPAVWFLNCHNEDDQTTKDTAVYMTQTGHVLANHMCKHDIMAAGDYKKFYYNDMTAKFSTEPCLQKPGQMEKFKSYFLGLIERYNALLPASARGTNYMTLLRLNGDGRFFKCLKAAAAQIRNDVYHLGWNYEVTNTETFKGRDKTAANPNGEFVPVAPGVKGTGLKPRDGDVILAHDLHWEGANRVANLRGWVQGLQNEGFSFVLPDAQGRCNGRPRQDT